MGKSRTVKLLQVALTEQERQALDEIALSEDVSVSSIVRELLAEEYPKFRQVYRPRSGYGGRGSHGQRHAT
jgi:hypothetical protein